MMVMAMLTETESGISTVMKEVIQSAATPAAYLR